MASLPYAFIRTIRLASLPAYLLTVAVYPKGVGVTAKPRSRLFRDMQVGIVAFVAACPLPLLLPDEQTVKMYTTQEAEKDKSMQFFSLLLLLSLFPLLSLY